MALVLALRIDQSFFVGSTEFVLREVHSLDDFVVENKGTGARHRITDRRMTEVLPEVFISVGDRQQNSLARLAIEAPQSVKILRGNALEKET